MSFIFTAAALPAMAQQLKVIEVNPAPGSQTTTSPTTISIVLNAGVEPTTVTASTVTLIEAGPDGDFNTADDVTVIPDSITVGGATVTLDLAGVTLPLGTYRIRVSGTSAVPAPAVNLFARWKLDEGAGTVVADSSGNGLAGSVNGPTWTTGLFGSALNFGGGAPRVDIDAGSIPPDWTVTMWVHRSANVVGTAASLTDSNSPYGTSLRMEQVSAVDQVGITEYTTIDHGFGFVAPLGTWVHLAFTSTTTTSQLYVNGVLATTSSLGFNLYLDKLGSATSTRTHSLTGLLSDVQVYGRILTGPEIASLAAITECVRSGAGDVLDGENAGALPSGDGAAGGTFLSTFSIVPILPEEDGGGGSGCGLVGIEAPLVWAVILLFRRRRNK